MMNKTYNINNIASQAKTVRGEYLSELLGTAFNGFFTTVKRSPAPLTK